MGVVLSCIFLSCRLASMPFRRNNYQRESESGKLKKKWSWLLRKLILPQFFNFVERSKNLIRLFKSLKMNVHLSHFEKSHSELPNKSQKVSALKSVQYFIVISQCCQLHKKTKHDIICSQSRFLIVKVRINSKLCTVKIMKSRKGVVWLCTRDSMSHVSQ